jgi:cytoskeletal protein RodZ
MFDWLVQAYDSNMTLSNDFFFVMRTGGPANMITPPLQDDDAISPSFKLNKLRNTSTIQASSSTTDSATPATAQPTTASSPDGPSPSPSGDQTTNTTNTPSPNSDAEQQENEGGGGALSVAAQAGIGVGVSVFAIIASACGVILFRYLKKQHKVVAELWERHHGADTKTTNMEQPQQKEGTCYYR